MRFFIVLLRLAKIYYSLILKKLFQYTQVFLFHERLILCLVLFCFLYGGEQIVEVFSRFDFCSCYPLFISLPFKIITVVNLFNHCFIIFLFIIHILQEDTPTSCSSLFVSYPLSVSYIKQTKLTLLISTLFLFPFLLLYPYIIPYIFLSYSHQTLQDSQPTIQRLTDNLQMKHDNILSSYLFQLFSLGMEDGPMSSQKHNHLFQTFSFMFSYDFLIRPIKCLQNYPVLSFNTILYATMLKIISCCAIKSIYIRFLREKMLGKTGKRLTMDDMKERLAFFLMNYEDPQMMVSEDECYSRLGKLKYRIALQHIANQKSNRLEIHIEDIEDMLRKQEDKAIWDLAKNNSRRCVEMFHEIIEKSIPPRNIELNPEECMRHQLQEALQKQRKENMLTIDPTTTAENELIPNKMHRKYHVVLAYRNRKPVQVRSISQLDSSMIGNLIILKGIVIRTEEIKPRLSVATYTCDVCGAQNYMEIFNDSFHPLTVCESKKCKENNIAGKLSFIPKHSRFIPSQQIKIQETPDQLREGNIPKNLKLVLTESNIKKALPGDVVQIQGVLMPKRKLGYSHEQDLIFDVMIEAFKIENQKKKYVQMEITQEEIQEITRVRKEMSSDQLYSKLSASIAPEIFGLQYVKKALLLLLAGGVTTVTHDRLRIRGQINVLLMGDPGVAKSQLLKHISHVAPRGVYTSGKGSSDVGLTACIKIDPVTKEVSLEAGALVLADMGICCIDQFDKMTEYDRACIHEVMEQQTVSIAKAGITTSLNARTSVLAAANPLFGRYNINETPQKNINLPAALLSRFDLIFLLLDTSSHDKDLQLARHIGQVHLQRKAPQATENIFSSKFLRNYIALAKSYQPKISPQLTNLLIEQYVKKRLFYADRVKQGEQYITTRNLLALIRMCQARAKLRFSNEITQQDILDCESVMMQCQKGVIRDELDRREMKDSISAIYGIIKEMCQYKGEKSMIDKSEVEKRVISRGFSLEDFNNTVHHYQNLGVLIVKGDKLLNSD